jgi:vacuolar fusion protein MON1
MKSDGLLDALSRSIRSEETDYSVSELGIPGLRHFLYKSRAQVQITFPTFEDPYDNTGERRRLVTLYQILHDALHAKSGQGAPLKLHYIKTDKESVMGWVCFLVYKREPVLRALQITQPFELYISLSPRLPKSAIINAANSVAKWVKKEDMKLFLKDAPVF